MIPNVRRATESDIPALCSLENECFSSPWSDNAFLDSIKNGTAEFYICLSAEGEAMGYVGIICMLDECSVTNVCTSAQYRKKGVATALLDMAESRAAELGAICMFLEVRVSNAAAIALYQNRGYECCGTRRGFYSKPKEDALVYKKDLI